MNVPVFLICGGMSAGWVGAIAYPLGTRQCKTREVTGKPSMQEGMMDAMGGSAPTDGNGMSTREHRDECPSVFDLGGNVRVMGRGDSIPFGYPSGQTRELSGEPSM